MAVADADQPTPNRAGPVTPLSLLEQMRANDPAAWRRLIGLYRPLVIFWCGRGGVRPADAEDVTQEVFAAAAGSLPRFHRDQPGDTFRGWLRGIARHCVLLHFRKNRGRTQAEGGSAAWQVLQAVVDPLAGADDGEEVEVSLLYRRALDLVRGEFEDGTWQAFWLTAVEGRSPAALAADLAMSPAAIRKAKSRVLRRLKAELGDLID
jgi:RNA polymerase sigma-70 factor (ECF subfamily)